MSARPDITRAEAVARAYELIREADDIAAMADPSYPGHYERSQALATRAVAYLKLAESGLLVLGEWTTSDRPDS